MISVEEAKELVRKHTPLLEKMLLPIESSINYCLASDILSTINMPPFDQSAMDGYALGSSEDLNSGTKFDLAGVIAAGDTSSYKVGSGQAYRIFTGAPVPAGTTAIVMQEWTNAHKESVTLTRDVKIADNIRNKGEQIGEGDVALKAGTIINPAAAGFLSSLGIDQVEVFKKPKVSIAVTGDELIKPGNALKHGQIYESNSYALSAAITSCGFDLQKKKMIPDNKESTIAICDELIKKSDVLVICGGISVGDHDYVGAALEELEIQKLFYKVKQKPGKPLLVGRLNNCMIFALPGNPAASLSCFYEYVLPSLRKMSGIHPHEMKKIRVPLADNFVVKGDRALFLKGLVSNGEVKILDGQSSAMMHSFAVANCIVYVSKTKGLISSGDLVEVHLIPCINS